VAEGFTVDLVYLVWLVVVFGSCWIGLGDGEKLVTSFLFEGVLYDCNDSIISWSGVWITSFFRMGGVLFFMFPYS
jgi:hypothetical protein